jgi:protein subunit release factor B
MKPLDKNNTRMDDGFLKRIYQEAKKLFSEDEVETLIHRATAPAGQPGNISTAVRLVHKATGIQITCDDYSSQTENYVGAAIRLRIACDKGDP